LFSHLGEKAKKKKKEESLEGKQRDPTTSEKTQKTATRSMNSGNKCIGNAKLINRPRQV